MFREMKADIIKDMHLFDGVCITTNAVIKANGRAVMGAGVAKLFRDKFRNIDLKLAKLISAEGNKCFYLHDHNNTKILTFPTKNDWKSDSCIMTIKLSCIELMKLVELHNLQNVALPRPGCNNGGLEWDYVKEEIRRYLDSRIIVVNK
jgi:hypothetical protein